MKILFVASEVAPYSKSGGLGDVAHALPRALSSRGHEVRVVTPALRDGPRRQRGGLGPLDPVALPLRRAARGHPRGAAGAPTGGLVPGSSRLLRPARPLRRRTRRLRRQPPALRLPRGGCAVSGAGDALRAGPRAPERLADRPRRARAGPRLSWQLDGRGRQRSSPSTTWPTRGMFSKDAMADLGLPWDVFTPQTASSSTTR